MLNTNTNGPTARFSEWLDATVAKLSPTNAKTKTQLFIIMGFREGCSPEVITMILSSTLRMSPIFIALQVDSLQTFTNGGRQ